MKYNPELHHRRSIRLKEYDYTRPGAYFITICAWKWECLFGEIKNAEMNLNEYGCIVKNCWNELPHHYSHIGLDMYVIMPNHMHGIIKIIDADTGTNTGANTNVGTNANIDVNANVDANVGAGFKPAPTMHKRHGLPEIVRALKTFSSRKINGIRNTPNIPVWQRNYYEHIIRNEKELNSIREYIINNPLRWDLDEDNPMNIN